MRGVICAVPAFLIFLSVGLSSAASSGPRGEPSSLERKIQAVLKDSSLKKAGVGIDVVALDTGEHVYSLQKDAPFVVASNMKLVTTAAALDLLGPDFKFRTAVYRLGPVDPSTGVLSGGLVIRGVGDPNISGRFFNDDLYAVPNAWAAAIKKLGVQEIRGDIVADDTLFDRTYVCPGWPSNQRDHWYEAEVCALSYNDNCLNVTIGPGPAPGTPAVVTIKPDTSYVTVTRSCVTTGSRKEHAIVLARKLGTNEILVGGKCWIGSPPLEEFITIHNPALYLATVFKEALERAGVKVVGAVRLADRPMKEAETPENEVASFGSWLSGTIAVANKRSQNFYAEQLFKVLGALKGGVGSFETGAAGVREFLNRLDGEGKSFVVTDGSGLSKTNRLTPALMTALLRHMYEHKFRDAFLGSLAVPCEEGSLEKRFKDEPYRSAVIAKTGYVAGASCLSGYAATRKERMLAFAIFMNRFNAGNPHMHALQDKICRALVDME